MNSAQISDNFSSGNTSSYPAPSGSYADMESASNVRLLPGKNSSASDIFQGHKSSRTMTTLAVISLFVSFFCLLVLGLFACWFFVLNDEELFPQASGLRSEKDAEVCVPCLQISPNPLDSSPSSLWGELDVRFGADNVTEICCASTSAQFAVLFKLILQRQQAVRKLADTLDAETTKKNSSDVMKDDVSGQNTTARVSQSAVSAHLVFKPKQTPRFAGAGGDPDSHKQQWKSPAESPMSHVQEGLQYHNKHIIIRTPGHYYVYCQVLYSPSHSVSADVNTHDVASAYVRRYSILRPAAPDFLLKMRHTRHDVTQDRHSSYAGGVFLLHSGDSLYVQVSRPDLMSHDDLASFFGLFRIGD